MAKYIEGSIPFKGYNMRLRHGKHPEMKEGRAYAVGYKYVWLG